MASCTKLTLSHADVAGMKLSSSDVTSCNILWKWVVISGLSFINTMVGSRWATSVLLCMNLLRKYFQQGSFFPSLGKRLLGESYDYYKLVNGWVWFET